MSFSLSNLFGSRAVDTPAAAEQPKSQEVELTEAPSTTSAPVAQAAGQNAKTNFEWNVGRLFSNETGKSQARTWAVRILSTVLVLPLVLTAIVDIGRRLAFAAGLIEGKSFSLIDKASEACKAIADKVTSVYASYNKPLTKEELNDKSQAAIKSLSQKLVDGFKALNGGYLHTNASFSSPAALNAEREIEKAKVDLVAQVNAYASRNAGGTSDFIEHLNTAKALVASSLAEAAGDTPYIENKAERNGPRPLLRNWANLEFQAKLRGNKETVEQFINFAINERDFGASLKKGVEAEILTKAQARSALKQEAKEAYLEGLKTGLDKANELLNDRLESGVESEVVTNEEAKSIDKSIQPGVDMLAEAAAKDVARSQKPNTTDDQITVQLSKAADGLKEKNKLKPEDETQFLTTAKAQLTRAREAVEAEALRQKQDAEEIEARQAAEIQKAADQSSLFGKFIGMLGLIKQKQEELTAKFSQFDELEAKRQTVTDALETIRTTAVTVRNVPMNILQAAAEYYKAVSAISNSKLAPAAKRQEVKDLEKQGFSQQTIDKINELKALEPQLTGALEQQDALAQAIDTQHEENATLIAKFKIYKKNNFAGLEVNNRKVVTDTETGIKVVQKTLDQRHRQLSQADTTLIGRLRSEPLRVVNLDPVANRNEVEVLVDAFDKAQKSASDEILIPDAISRASIVWNGVKSVGSFLATPITYPIGLISARWNR